MSKDAVAAFLKKALEDTELRKELTELAGRHGYAFTVDELSETELGSVAGGLLNIVSTAPILQKELTMQKELTTQKELSGSIVFDKF
ncbi:MAG: Nif11 family protein [Gemmatimonadetes bacterium]|nr:Nif11 family protein [Gemmatimonadota bacterium]